MLSSSIVNGFDREKLAVCPYPVIPQYMNARPIGSVGIAGARVTHLWTDRADEAPPVAAAALIPNVVARPQDVIGHVDAVLIATDDGFDHVERARPFVDAGLPVFIDKPLALTISDLRTFVGWRARGARTACCASRTTRSDRTSTDTVCGRPRRGRWH